MTAKALRDTKTGKRLELPDTAQTRTARRIIRVRKAHQSNRAIMLQSYRLSP